jgi:Domain of unknown function (DUF4404)
MNPDNLRQTLAALQRELSETPTLDESSRQLLREIMTDVERLGASPATAAPTLHRHRLEELAVDFEIDHPAVAAGLRQLMDLVAKAGL